MGTERTYQAALIHLEQELEGFVGAVFSEVSSGLVLAAHSVIPELHQRTLIDVARSALLAHLELERTGRSAAPEELIVMTAKHIHLHQLVDEHVLLSLSAAREDANLAIVKAAARQCCERIGSATPTAALAAAAR